MKTIIFNKNFICPKCSSNASHSTDDSRSSFKIEDGEVIEEVESFNYLGNCFDCDNGVEKTVRGRIDAAWLSWRNISSLLRNNMMPLKYRSGIYDACIRPVLLYESETWALTHKLVETLVRNESKMLRRLVGIKFSGQRGNPLVGIYGIPRLEIRLRSQRLRWFGHILRKPKNSLTLKVVQYKP